MNFTEKLERLKAARDRANNPESFADQCLQENIVASQVDWLIEASEKMHSALNWYRDMAGDHDFKIENALEKAMEFRERNPNDKTINPAGKFLAAKARETLNEIEAGK